MIASAIAWIPLGALVAIAELLIVGRPITMSRVFAGTPVYAAVGAFCGLAFGLALAAAERKRTFESLTMGRFVALGVGSALVIPVTAILADFGGFTTSGMAYALALFGVPGGISAAALLSIARRAPPQLESADTPIALKGAR
jgi:uncharacterized membrane protein